MKKWTEVIRVNKAVEDKFTVDEDDRFILDDLLGEVESELQPAPVDFSRKVEGEQVRG